MSVEIKFGASKKPPPVAPPKKPASKSSSSGGGGGSGFWTSAYNYATDPSNWIPFGKLGPPREDEQYVSIPHDENASFANSVSYIQNIFRHSSKYDNAQIVLLDENENVVQQFMPDAVHMKDHHHAEVVNGDVKFTFDAEGRGTYKGTQFSSVEVRWEDGGLKTFKI